VLRKAVGKKIKTLLDEQGGKLVDGMVANGIEKKTAEKIWDFIIPFARYGFNRAHAACYGMISYQTAFLKANYPAQFMAALLASDQAHIDRVAIDVAEAKHLGLAVMPPDVNESFPSFAVVPHPDGKPADTIRFGLAAVKNVGLAVAEAIVEERKAGGPYATLADFLQRVRHHGVNRKALESLIKTGGLDCLGERGSLLANLERLSEFNRRASQDQASGQGGLFDLMGGLAAPKLQLDPAPPADKGDILLWEKELLGLYISDHPLRQIPVPSGSSLVAIASLGEHVDKTVQTRVVVNTVKRIITKTGKAMLACGVEDEFGSACELVVFPKTLEQTYALWRPAAPLLVTAKVSDKDGVPKLLAEGAQYLR
jgi:DNA polymerase-3 subunit alpha